MANTSAPFGFRQISGTGSAPTYEQVVVRIAYNAAAIFFGDPVLPDSGGFVVVGAPGTDTGAYNYVIVAFNNVSTKQLTSVG